MKRVLSLALSIIMALSLVIALPIYVQDELTVVTVSIPIKGLHRRE